jgi:hypothetical protein
MLTRVALWQGERVLPILLATLVAGSPCLLAVGVSLFNAL